MTGAEKTAANRRGKLRADRLVLCGLIVLALLCSLIVLGGRAAAEMENRHTLLTLEWSQLKDTAARNGYTVEDALAKLLPEGEEQIFSGVVYKEPTLYDWQNGGYLMLDSGTQLMSDMRAGNWQTDDSFASDFNHNYVLCYDEALQQRVYEHLQNKTSAQNILHTFRAGDTLLYAVETSYPYTDLVALGIGFGETDLALIKQFDLDLVVQVRSWPKVNAESLEFVFGNLAALDVKAVGFNDTELPGVQQNDWSDIAKKLTEILQRQGLPTLSIEFYSQKGLQSFTAAMGYDMVRMHPVSESELLKLSDTRLQERFALAASERSMGVLMLRLRANQSLDDAVDYVAGVRDAVQAKGVPTDEIAVVPDMQVAPWTLLAALAGVWAGGVLLMQKFDMKRWAWLLPTVAAMAAVLLLFVTGTYWVQKLIALAAVVIFPFLAVALFADAEGKSLPGAIGALCGMTLVSLSGAAIMAATLSERSYMSAVNVFSGVKLGQLVPLLLLMVYLLYKLAAGRGGATYLLVEFTRLMKKQVTIGMVLLAGVAAVLLLVYMMRTGNTSAGISDYERAFRAFLDQVLLVRPRTKEFMIAHPIMLAILYFGYRRNLWPVVLLGAIGQVSLVNTFEHLHTPVLISLLRTFNGLWLGVVLGVVLIFCVKYIGGWAYRKIRMLSELAEDASYEEKN